MTKYCDIIIPELLYRDYQEARDVIYSLSKLPPVGAWLVYTYPGHQD